MDNLLPLQLLGLTELLASIGLIKLNYELATNTLKTILISIFI